MKCVHCYSLFAIVTTQIGNIIDGLGLTQIPEVTTNWIELVSQSNSLTFSPRNAHASCVFKGQVWVVGGRTDTYTAYNLQSSYRVADVWSSRDGATWTQQTKLKGDFWAQNSDVPQPGLIAPWYSRYGHTLNAVDTNGDGSPDVMILTGGFSPAPSNDVWVTEDGVTWVYAGLAPWSPRAWHASAVFQGSLWIAGGSPLNNEVWRAVGVIKDNQPPQPLTRSMKASIQYSVQWLQYAGSSAASAASLFSPRAGMGLAAQWYFNATSNETITDARERLVLVGGFGGWPQNSTQYDGMHAYSDVWVSSDGADWTLVTSAAAFGPRAFFGHAVYHGADKRADISAVARSLPPRFFLVGGGDVGGRTDSTKHLTSVNGRMDTYWSRDMALWTRVNYKEGGDMSFLPTAPPAAAPALAPSIATVSYASRAVPQYSSQEWAKYTANSQTVYTGLWGLTVLSFNSSTGVESPGNLLLLGGVRTGAGTARSSSVYQSAQGLLCDIEGVPCSYKGSCRPGTGGCGCAAGFIGEYCAAAVHSSAGVLDSEMSWACLGVFLLLLAGVSALF